MLPTRIARPDLPDWQHDFLAYRPAYIPINVVGTLRIPDAVDTSEVTLTLYNMTHDEPILAIQPESDGSFHFYDTVTIQIHKGAKASEFSVIVFHRDRDIYRERIGRLYQLLNPENETIALHPHSDSFLISSTKSNPL